MNVSKVSFSYPFVRFLIDSVEISTAAAISLVAYWCKDCFFPPKTQRCLMRLLKL